MVVPVVTPSAGRMDGEIDRAPVADGQVLGVVADQLQPLGRVQLGRQRYLVLAGNACILPGVVSENGK